MLQILSKMRLNGDAIAVYVGVDQGGKGAGVYERMSGFCRSLTLTTRGRRVVVGVAMEIETDLN